MGINLENIDKFPQSFRDQIRKQREPKPSTTVDEVPPPVEITKADKISEKELQTTCENYLTLHDYLRLTADNAEIYNEYVHAGFFGHLHKAKRNPLMPDLWIINRNGRVLNVELKVVSVYQRGQKEMIDAGFWHEIRTFEGFVELVDKWENEG